MLSLRVLLLSSSRAGAFLQAIRCFPEREIISGGAYRLRFGRELTDLICSFDFSREENFDKRVMVETILHAYCDMPYAEREKVYYYDCFCTVQECIREHTILEIRVRTVPGELRSFTYKPYVLRADDSSLLCYLAGYSREIGTKAKYGIYSVRLQRVVSAINTKQSFTLDISQVNELDRRIEEFGIAYVNLESVTPIRVALTNEGYQKYLKVLLHQRPLPSAPVEICDGDYPYVLTFQCSKYQISNYFFPFGEEAQVLEPIKLREAFAERYHRASTAYSVH